MGALADITADLVATLQGAGIEVITDPRQLRPHVTLVEPPRVVGISGKLSDVEWDLNVCTLPATDVGALTALLDIVDVIVETVPVSSANPGTYSTGNQELPAYTVTVKQTIRRD